MNLMKLDNPNDVRLELPAQEVWARAKEILSTRMSQPAFQTWVSPIGIVEITASDIVLAVANEFNRGFATRHLSVITEVLGELLGRPVNIRLTVDSSYQCDYIPSIAAISVSPESSSTVTESSSTVITHKTQGNEQSRVSAANLNPRYTMENFVVGSNNRFCHSAALAVADKPGQSYNPLFLYGGVGLGKTHIMQAIGNQILRNNPDKVVRYITCERFTNDVIASIRENRMIDLRKRYRQADVLLVDDVQFLEGKETTQEEFFHTFNALRDSGKQIVLTSDRPPKSLSKLEERLRSRFEWGLITDLQPPDYETRLAILSKKCELDGLHIEQDSLDYIARTCTNNIRELEGALNCAHACSDLTGVPLTLETLKTILKQGNSGTPKPPYTIENVIDAVAAQFRVDISDLRSARRSQDLAVPRHIAMYLCHEILSMSFQRIGDYFGKRKHTSALYAFDKVKESLPKDRELADSIKQIMQRLSV